MRVKGGFVFFHPRKIILTSPERAEQEFSYRAIDEQRTVRSDFGQLKRRINHEVMWNEQFNTWGVVHNRSGSEQFVQFEFE